MGRKDFVSMISPFEWIVLAFATYRFTRLLVWDDITAWLRRPFIKETEMLEENGEKVLYLEGKGRGLRKWVGSLLSCYWCTGVWVALFFYGGYVFFPLLFWPLAVLFSIAAVAAILETMTRKLE
jgi:hypothetical protein